MLLTSRFLTHSLLQIDTTVLQNRYELRPDDPSHCQYISHKSSSVTTCVFYRHGSCKPDIVPTMLFLAHPEGDTECLYQL